MECNPYATKHNPYHDLPRDFLLYRAAYPIRYNDKSSIEIAKQSMGMNVRMYRMSIGAMKSRSISSSIDQDNFDLWKVFYLIQASTTEEKALALENMKRLDPLNPDVTAR